MIPAHHHSEGESLHRRHVGLFFFERQRRPGLFQVDGRFLHVGHNVDRGVGGLSCPAHLVGLLHGLNAVGFLFDRFEGLFRARLRHGLEAFPEGRSAEIEPRAVELHGRHLKGNLFAVGLFEDGNDARGLVGIEAD